MKAETKKVIAREGLVLLGFVILSLIMQLWGASGWYGYFAQDIPDKCPAIFRLLQHYGKLLIVVGYPAYLLIRFIIWAIKTLKNK